MCWAYLRHGKPPSSEDTVQIETYLSGLRVVGAEGGLADLQGAFVLGAGAGQVPQAPQHAAEVVAPDADGGVVGAEGGLADLQGAFELGAGAGQVAQGLQNE